MVLLFNITIVNPLTTPIANPETDFPTAIKLNITNKALLKGETLKLSATIMPDSSYNKTITFTSSNSSVASVDSNGKITALKGGTAIITAKTYNNLSASCKITVVDKCITHILKTKIIKSTLYNNGKTIIYCSKCKKTLSEKVIYKIKSVKLSKTEYEYNSSESRKPSVKIYDSMGNKLVYGEDYTYKRPSSSKNVGKYEVKVTFKGNYSGTKSLYYKIIPRDTKFTSLKAGSKKLTVKWSRKLTQSTGYQIQYSTSSTFKEKYTKTITIKSDKTTSKTISKLKAKKRYYVRIRCYYGNKTRYYSDWSTKKNKATKK